MQILHENIPLAPLTTMGLGGPARYLAECTSLAEMRDCLTWAEAEGLPVQVLGGGSNVLFADAGYSGLVLKVGLSGVVFNGATVEVAAGEDWDAFVQCCVERGLAGVECLSGIPGSVGATPIQNVGAYGQEVKDTIAEVRALDRQTLEEIAFAPAECGFAYRQSRFKGADRDRFIVTSVTYRLDDSGQPQIRYPELRRHVSDDRPTLATVRDTVLALRRGKSMVIDPQDPNSRSVGSFFLNPVIDAEAFDASKGPLSQRPALSRLRLASRCRLLGSSSRRDFTRGCDGAPLASRSDTRWPWSIAAARPAKSSPWPVRFGMRWSRPLGFGWSGSRCWWRVGDERGGCSA